jgi:hypothetical protein
MAWSASTAFAASVMTARTPVITASKGIIRKHTMAGLAALALDAAGYRSLLKRAAKDGVDGGRTYDAIIAECAVHAQAKSLLTFNALDFAACGSNTRCSALA